VVTAGALNALPYDLWQQGHPVRLALHTFFPDYAYPIIRQLTPYQRWQLSQVPPPSRKLGRRATMDALLGHLFAVNLAQLAQPAGLIAWLNAYHARPDPMPAVLVERLQTQLESRPVYTEWPLAELLADRESFQRFINGQWQLYLQQQTGQVIAETEGRYLLSFESSDSLQDTVPGLIRSGLLTPVAVDNSDRLPAWTRPAVVAPGEDRRPQRIAARLDLLGEQATPLAALAEARWEEWQAIARTWAELTALYYDPAGKGGDQMANLAHRYAHWQNRLDEAFLTWLRRRYALLGGRKLPGPHHLYHIPAYIAYRRRSQNPARPFVLLIMDGMSLADWHLVGAAWRARRPDWQFQEQLALAQLPTITAISRQALVSGLRPADFSDTLTHNRAEPGQWTAFWQGEGLSAGACFYGHLALNRREPPPELTGSRLQAACLIVNAIDDLVHSARLGAADMQASLKLWLDQESPQLEALLDSLLKRGFTLYLTSDHGHIEAQGMGRPSEGVMVETRSQRARVYRDELTARAVQQNFPGSIMWGDDSLLPAGALSVMAGGRSAFAGLNETVVTHGGPTLAEVVVPLVQIGF
jgi:hypothetical protein